jgi:hypothetical protein
LFSSNTGRVGQACAMRDVGAPRAGARRDLKDGFNLGSLANLST